MFIMEPCFNPALESQAIGRVYRLGQKREVVITRLIQEESIETRLMKFLENKYGSKKEGGGGESKENDDGEDKKLAAAAPTLVGNLSTDKARLMRDEFDLLFGAQDYATSAEGGADSNVASMNYHDSSDGYDDDDMSSTGYGFL